MAVITIILMTVGAVFILVASLGILRLPDVYMRVSATTKAVTLGVGSLVAGAAVHFHDLHITSRAAAVIVLIMSTAAVAAHMIGRAAYFAGVPLWKGTLYDELDRHGTGAPPAPSPPPPTPPPADSP